MKKVVVINFTGRTGGGPIDAFEMAKAMIDSGKNIIAILSEDCSNLKEWKKLRLEKMIQLSTYHDKASLLSSSLRFLVLGDRRIKELKNNYEIDYIYCPMVSLWTRMINLKIGRKYRSCVVNHDPIPHTGDKALFLMNLFGLQKIYKEADSIVVHSRRFVNYVEERYGKKGRVLYIPLGRQDYIKRIEVLDSKISYDDTQTNFLFFGRIEPYKGINILLDAYEQVIERCKNVSLTIAGSGDCGVYMDQIKRLNVRLVNRWIKDEEIGNFFHGENLVLVLPYLDATQSGVVLVALEYGIPSICSDTGGLSEQVKNGKTGILVPAGNSKGLSEVMIQMAAEPEYRTKLSAGIPDMLEELEWRNLASCVDEFMRMNMDSH